MTWIVGTAAVVALGEKRRLPFHLTGRCDVAFYGMDTFIDLWNPIEKVEHNGFTVRKVLSLIVFLSFFLQGFSLCLKVEMLHFVTK